MVKTQGGIAVASAARSVFEQTAPDFALDNFQTMQQAVDQSNFNSRLGLYLISSFAGLAVLMVVAGLYGVLAQLVTYRRREIGVRLALGATRKNVVIMVLRQGSILLCIGLALGLGLALATGRFLKSFLFGVKTVDILTYSGALALLFVVGILAAFVPAWRAATVEPTEALREQ
jgi:ABC-type antimicrobial peptide transport system permease subunit